MSATPVNWQDEARRYDIPHPRLRQVAGLIRELHPRRILDVGCATAALRTLLPRDIVYYGCDVTDHAAIVLPAGRFMQVDFNRAFDLSPFAGQGIELAHIGGVLEYLERPAVLLQAVHRLLGAGAPLIVTIINFEAAIYCTPEAHHPGWIFKPKPAELERLLTDTGWMVQRKLPVFGTRWRSRSAGQALRWTLGENHLLTRRQAEQFIVLARAL